MSDPRPARSLALLRADLDADAPNRSKASDGWLGDQAHAARKSDHNPNAANVVRAMDFTHDPDGGLDCNELAEFLTDLMREHPALGSGAYVIWNHRIWSADRDLEGWRHYPGANPHDKHLHLSVGLSGYDTTAPWGWLEEDDVTPEDIEAIADRVVEKLLNASVPSAVSELGKRKVSGMLTSIEREAAK